MRPAAWTLLLLVVLAPGLPRAQSAAEDVAATTSFATMTTDADISAVTEAATPEATTIQDVMTTVGVNLSATDELMIITKLSEQGAEARSLPVAGAGAVVVSLDHPAVPVALPSLDGEAEEDFMEDMQEIEQGSDMLMEERSAAPAVPAPLDQEQEEDILSDPLPPNHKQSAQDFSPDTNSLVGKQHRFVTAMPPDHDSEMKKYERMMAKLPVRDYPGYNVTGRDKPLNVVFVFPRVSEGNQTRPRELEVVLVFPQANASTTAATATEATATTAAVPVPTVSVGEEAALVDGSDDKLELASERKETRESAPSHLTSNGIGPDASKATRTTASDAVSGASSATETTTVITPTTAPSTTLSTTPGTAPTTPTPTTPVAPTPSPAFHRWKLEPGAYRQDIFKKYANKYASSRPPPVSFFRKDSGSAATRRTGGDDGDLETGASEVEHTVLPASWLRASAPGAGADAGEVEHTVLPASWLRAPAPGAAEVEHTVLPASWLRGLAPGAGVGRGRAPPPLYIPARLHAARPPQHFPSLPPAGTGMQPMLVAGPPHLPPRMAVLNGTQQAHPADVAAAPVSTSSDADASLPETLPEVQPEVRPQAPQVTPVPVPPRGRVRHGRPAGAPAPVTQGDIAASAMTEGAHPVEPKRTQTRRRPLRDRQHAPDTLTTTSVPDPASTPRPRGRPQLRPTLAGGRPQDTPRVHPQPTVRPAAPQAHAVLRPWVALRERLPGVRPGRPTSAATPARASAPAPTTEATQALTVEEAATIKKITALQSGKSGAELGPQGRMARLSSLQSMLVANLVAIQRELAERHADLRRHMDSLHLPAEHRAQVARTFSPGAASTPAPPAHSASTTTGPMRRRYRRPPALRVRKPPVPAEDKEQAARDNKVSYRTLYKKRVSVPTGKLTLSTSATTTTTTTPTTAASLDTMTTTTTPFLDQQTTTDEPSASTEANVETTSASQVQEDTTAPTTVPTTEEATGVTEALSTTSESYPSSPAAALSTPNTDPEAAAPTDAPADFTAEGSALAPVAAALTADAAPRVLVPVVAASLPGAAEVLGEDLLGFQPSQRDPVHRPGPGRSDRLSLLGGVLPEDDPAVASGLFGLERHGRDAFRAPLRMEGGFVPMIPGSALALQQPAGAPQIVGPIPGGYRDVLRGTPVQLDLPRPDKPSDFLGRPVAAAPVATAPAALPPRLVKRVMGVPLRTAAVAAPHRQG